MTDPRPTVSKEELSADMEHYYSINTSAVKQLESYDDTMYLFTDTHDRSRYIAKYYNLTLMSEQVLWKIMEVLEYLGDFTVPKPVKPSRGDTVVKIEKCGTTKGCKDACLLAVFHFIEGEQLDNKKQEKSFWTKLGVLVGNLSVAMSEIKHTEFHRDHSWDPLIVDKGLIEDQPHFPTEQLPKLNLDDVIKSVAHTRNMIHSLGLPQQLVHGDLNEFNIIISGEGEIGIIDFNDLINSARVVEIAHMLAYSLLAQANDFQVARAIYAGYSSVITLSRDEISLIYDLILSRITFSTARGSSTMANGLGNEYVRKCVEDNIQFLKTFTENTREEFNNGVLGV